MSTPARGPVAPSRWLAWALAHPLRIALALLVISRAQGFIWGVLNLDEADFVTLARVWAEGGLPYVDFFEKKPVLSYLFYLPSALAGWSLWPTQVLALVWALATAWVCGEAAFAWTARERDRTAALLLCALAQCASIPSVNTETMLNLPAALALLAFAKGARAGGRTLAFDFAAGLCVGVASLFRHQAGIGLAALGLAMLIAALRGGPGLVRRLLGLLVRVGALAGGFLFPWAVALFAWQRMGHLADFLEWNFARNFAYAGRSDLAGALWRFPGGVILGVLLAAPLAWWMALRETRRVLGGSAVPERGTDREGEREGESEGERVGEGDRDREGEGEGGGVGERDTRILLVVSLWLTWLPVSLGGRFYDHYFLQFIPLVAILGAPGIADLLSRWPALGLRARVLVGLTIAAPLLFWFGVGVSRGLKHEYPLQDARVVTAADYVRAHSAPDDRIFVWGHYSPFYVLSQRRPGARAYVATLVTGDFDPGQVGPGFDVSKGIAARDVRLALEDLARLQPRFIIDTAPADLHGWGRVPLTTVPELAQAVRERYVEVAQPGGMVVYRRR